MKDRIGSKTKAYFYDYDKSLTKIKQNIFVNNLESILNRQILNFDTRFGPYRYEGTGSNISNYSDGWSRPHFLRRSTDYAVDSATHSSGNFYTKINADHTYLIFY